MNYTELTTLVLQYSNRQDVEVVNNIDNFFRVVESRVNRLLKTQDQSIRTRLVTDIDQEYFGLPLDFAGLRDIEITNIDGSSRQTLRYVTPEQMNNYELNTTPNNNASAQITYTIIAQQIQIFPTQDNKVLEIIYYQRVPELSTATPTNWVSNYYPDAYLFGAMVEINAFVKDAEAVVLWDERFKLAVDEMANNDSEIRWSGTPLQMKVTN